MGDLFRDPEREPESIAFGNFTWGTLYFEPLRSPSHSELIGSLHFGKSVTFACAGPDGPIDFQAQILWGGRRFPNSTVWEVAGTAEFIIAEAALAKIRKQRRFFARFDTDGVEKSDFQYNSI